MKYVNLCHHEIILELNDKSLILVLDPDPIVAEISFRAHFRTQIDPETNFPLITKFMTRTSQTSMRALIPKDSVFRDDIDVDNTVFIVEPHEYPLCRFDAHTYTYDVTCVSDSELSGGDSAVEFFKTRLSEHGPIDYSLRLKSLVREVYSELSDA